MVGITQVCTLPLFFLYRTLMLSLGVLRKLLKALRIEGIITEDLSLPNSWTDLELCYRGLCQKDSESHHRRIGTTYFTLPLKLSDKPGRDRFLDRSLGLTGCSIVVLHGAYRVFWTDLLLSLQLVLQGDDIVSIVLLVLHLI